MHKLCKLQIVAHSKILNLMKFQKNLKYPPPLSLCACLFSIHVKELREAHYLNRVSSHFNKCILPWFLSDSVWSDCLDRHVKIRSFDIKKSFKFIYLTQCARELVLHSTGGEIYPYRWVMMKKLIFLHNNNLHFFLWDQSTNSMNPFTWLWLWLLFPITKWDNFLLTCKNNWLQHRAC